MNTRMLPDDRLAMPGTVGAMLATLQWNRLVRLLLLGKSWTSFDGDRDGEPVRFQHREPVSGDRPK